VATINYKGMDKTLFKKSWEITLDPICYAPKQWQQCTFNSR